MKAPFLRTAYNYDMNEAGDESGLECKDPTLTQQHFKDEVDINTIVERFGLTGEMPQLQQLPSYGDYSGIFDYQTAMNAVRAADESFMNLPAKIRNRFDNNPQKFVDFCEDDDNKEEAYKLGIALRPEQDKPLTDHTTPPGDKPQTPPVTP